MDLFANEEIAVTVNKTLKDARWQLVTWLHPKHASPSKEQTSLVIERIDALLRILPAWVTDDAIDADVLEAAIELARQSAE